MWGMDPVVAWFGPTSYYMQLAHEYGCKTIVIDPRYTQSAEILADQWIPIRPGTDLAMMLAVAQVLYEEDLIDHEFVDAVGGCGRLRGMARLRAWAKARTASRRPPSGPLPSAAVPADTIREFAAPVRHRRSRSTSSTSTPAPSATWATTAAAASMLLQAMTGNIACHGRLRVGRLSAHAGPCRRAPRADFRPQPAAATRCRCCSTTTASPRFSRCQDDYWNGQDQRESEFRHLIGSAHQRLPAAEHPDDHLREQLRQQPLEREQALRRHGATPSSTGASSGT